jgi:hypothetical protein
MKNQTADFLVALITLKRFQNQKKVDVNLKNLKLALIISFSVDYSLIKKGVVRTNHGRGKQNTRKKGEKGGRGRLLFTFRYEVP